jgi:NADPH:quinone reductase
MDRAIRLRRPGGVEELETIDLELAAPAAGEIAIRHLAIGVNFIDIYHRTGLYPLAEPAIPGVEGVGVVSALGPGVAQLSIGQTIVYAGQVGAYASSRLLPAWRAIPLPGSIPPETAAASFVRGITCDMLTTKVFRPAPGATALVHAAAGGRGEMLTKWLTRQGVRVIGTVGSEPKAEVARAAGAAKVIVGRQADFAAEVMAWTGGVGVDFAVDGVGGPTLAKTLLCVRPFGTVASIGQAGGPIPPLNVGDIGPRRSLLFARPSVMAYMSDKDAYREGAQRVLRALAAGIAVSVAATFPLDEAASAQRELEGAAKAGAIVLKPSSR